MSLSSEVHKFLSNYKHINYSYLLFLGAPVVLMGFVITEDIQVLVFSFDVHKFCLINNVLLLLTIFGKQSWENIVFLII